MRSKRPTGGRLASWLVGRYPAAWRERYEEEMRMLLEERTVTFGDAWDVLRNAGGEWMRLQGWRLVSRQTRTLIIGILSGLGAAWLANAGLIVSKFVEAEWAGQFEGKQLWALGRTATYMVHPPELGLLMVLQVYAVLCGGVIAIGGAVLGLRRWPLAGRAVTILGVLAVPLWLSHPMVILEALVCATVLARRWFPRTNPAAISAHS